MVPPGGSCRVEHRRLCRGSALCALTAEQPASRERGRVPWCAIRHLITARGLTLCGPSCGWPYVARRRRRGRSLTHSIKEDLRVRARHASTLTRYGRPVELSGLTR